jgi:hypothetical protein
MISTEEFWKRCPFTTGKVYVFIDERALSGFSMPRNCQLQPIGFYGKTILLEKRSEATSAIEARSPRGAKGRDKNHIFGMP